MDVPIFDTVLEEYLKIFGIPVITYKEIDQYHDLNTLFDTYQVDALILYNESSDNLVGHYTVLLRRTDLEFQFFDSIECVPDKFQDSNLIESILKRSPSGTTIDYGSTQLQSVKSNTCGRWCIDRVLKMRMTGEQYYDYYKHVKKLYKDLDEFILMTVPISKEKNKL